tara:strand:+ start:429 stop:773 length:345 start_codon:yes stop_codon:yes gene_type:complete
MVVMGVLEKHLLSQVLLSLEVAVVEVVLMMVDYTQVQIMVAHKVAWVALVVAVMVVKLVHHMRLILEVTEILANGLQVVQILAVVEVVKPLMRVLLEQVLHLVGQVQLSLMSQK